MNTQIPLMKSIEDYALHYANRDSMKLVESLIAQLSVLCVFEHLGAILRTNYVLID